MKTILLLIIITLLSTSIYSETTIKPGPAENANPKNKALIATPIKMVTKAGVSFPDSLQIDKTKLLLNGIGIRTKTIFSVKVYVGALYLTKKNSIGKNIVNSKEIKHIKMHFVRDVTAKQMKGGWDEAFENSKVDKKKFKKEIKDFYEAAADMPDKSIMTLTFSKKGLGLNIKGSKRFIKGASFANAVLSVWFVNADDTDLRDGFLGKLK